LLEEMGVDAIDISAGAQAVGFPRATAAIVEPMGYQQGWKTYLAREVKKHVKIPVITVGVIREPDIAEGILARKEADFVALGRALLADPFWPMKAHRGESHLILRCVSCREACITGRAFNDRPISCAINPGVGDEDTPLPLVSKTKRVTVIGGGASGMKFALTARELGHQVDLYEQEKELGGQLNLACIPAKREKLRWVIEDFEALLRAQGVGIHLNEKISHDRLSKLAGDVLVIATGSNPFFPERIRGRSDIVDARQILRAGHFPAKGTIIVAGGGTVGCEVSMFAKGPENQVILIEQLETMAQDMEPLTRQLLLADLDDSGVVIKTGVKITEVKDHQVSVTSKDEAFEMDFDLLIVALGSESVCGPGTELERMFPEVYRVGDAAQPGKLMDAVHGARNLALQVLA
jgi:thioredoxin reductase